MLLATKRNQSNYRMKKKSKQLLNLENIPSRTISIYLAITQAKKGDLSTKAQCIFPHLSDRYGSNETDDYKQ